MSHSEIATDVVSEDLDQIAEVAEAGVGFADIGLAPVLTKALEEAGYTSPTPIQLASIPLILQGQDVMASAQTGTGKTAAFMLPSLQKLSQAPARNGRGPRIVVLTPTRELAQQITDAATKYGRGLPRLRVVSIVGGASYFTQNKLLSQPVDILVATPGRLIDHLQRGRVDFDRLEMLVLDEADRMLDMGFSEAVETIAAATPAERQTCLFSATLEGVVGNLADRLLKNPQRVNIASARTRHENIEQRLHYVDDMQHKNRLLEHLLADIELKQAIVFTATKRDADQLADDLAEQGHAAAALHGDMNQRDRNRTLLQLRRGQVRVLVATDVAARGIDVNGITHVINYDLPKFAEDYVHRIGRTGRAGAQGIAISFASPRDRGVLSRIERFTGQPIRSSNIAGLEPKARPQPSGRGRREGGEGRRDFARDGQRRDFNRDAQPREFGQNRAPFARTEGQGRPQPRDGQRRDAGNREFGNRDFASRDGQPRDFSKGNDFGNRGFRDSQPRSTQPRDAQPRDGQRRDFGNRDAQPRGEFGNRSEFAGRPPFRGDNAARGERDGQRREFGNRDFAQRDGQRRDFGNRDSQPRGEFARRPAVHAEPGQRLLTTHELGLDVGRDTPHRRPSFEGNGAPRRQERRPAQPGAGRRAFTQRAGNDWNKD